MLFIIPILYVFVAVIFTEALTELVVKSEIFYPVRKFLFKSESRVLRFIHGAVDCGYCFSVWASMFSVYLIFFTTSIYIKVFIGIIIIHRMSNLWHSVLDIARYYNKE